MCQGGKVFTYFHLSSMIKYRLISGAGVPILWPPDMKSWLIIEDPDAGMAEDEMVAWHHRLNGHEFEQAPGDGEGQGGLACYSPWGCKELGTTEQLNWTMLPSEIPTPTTDPPVRGFPAVWKLLLLQNTLPRMVSAPNLSVSLFVFCYSLLF